MSAADWQGRTAVITGGTGFIGRALAGALAARGAQVVVPSRNPPATRAGVRHVRCRLDRADEIAALARGTHVLFNLAYDFRRGADANARLFRHIADGAAQAGVPVFVQTSSIAVYDDWPRADLTEDSPCDGPGHDYKIAKRAAEIDIAARVARGQFDAAILQPTIVYGPGSTQWTDSIVDRMRGGTLVLPRALDGLCNGVFVDDVVEAMIAAAERPRGGDRFILSGPAPFPWRDLFLAYAEACGAEVREVDVARPALSPAPAPSRRPLAARLAQGAAAAAGDLIGTARLDALRSRVISLKPGQKLFDPAAEQPRLFWSRGVAGIAKSVAGLRAPQVGAEEGLRRTQDAIRTRLR